ncbi:MAG: M20/M25/M40 family metallo-hydrolase [Gemmatimonadota bacterium]|jgi:acetylornithine deacetylase/succinyl-diaminopimelate desuccinylase-like protein
MHAPPDRPSPVPSILLAAALGTAWAAGLATPAAAQEADLARLQDEAVERTVEYLRIDTTNPPGNEVRGVEFFARIFEEEGIPWDSASSAPGRGNVWARLEGGDRPALVLLHHMDVVPADPEYWDTDPLAAEVSDGMIAGRGALDTKTLGIVQLEAFLGLHRSGAALDRDIVFMATADEEAGGFHGAGWLVENRPELFEDVGVLLNEGGDGLETDGEIGFGIEVTQKVPIWLELTAHGTPGHGSTPPVESAVNRLIRGLHRLQTYRFAPHIVPAVDAFFKGLAPTVGAEWGPRFANIAEAVEDPDVLRELQIDHRSMAALTRNTCSITMLDGSDKINVVPPTAQAQIDCRMLPDQDPEALLAELRTVLNDPGIEIERIMQFTPAVSSTETDLYRTLVDVTSEEFPDAAIIPAVSTGFTDSHFMRDLGIDAYGYSPFVIPQEDEGGVHGNDERISVENIRRGTAMMLEILRRFALPTM